MNSRLFTSQERPRLGGCETMTHQDKMSHGVSSPKHKLEGHTVREAVIVVGSACLHVGSHCLQEGWCDECSFTGHGDELI